MRQKECVAMLLAGGQGSRLGVLTEKIAKPAVSFGGKYRMIDFSLSNCVNSGIDTVGVLVQYKPTLLNRYLGTGAAWDLDATWGGVQVLPPYATQAGGEWYEGTADAIYHNIDFIDEYDPEYVLILSGDHLYQMDYNLMLDFHKLMNADLTVAVKTVPWEEASRFGIMTADDEGRIVKFSEKPKNPDSNLASMGIYIFAWKALKKALLDDHEDPSSERDFGKNVIPRMLGEGQKLFTYRFDGYWKDVGTIDSYYGSQMELLEKDAPVNIFERDMRIFSNTNNLPPSFMGPDAKIKNSLVCNGCGLFAELEHSIMGSGSRVYDGSVVKDSIILPNAIVGRNCRVTRAIINEDIVIPDGSVIGSDDGEITVVGKNFFKEEQ